MPKSTENRKYSRQSSRIASIEKTEERFTGRGGLALFVRFLERSGLTGRLSEELADLRKTEKGISVGEFVKQLFCFFLDGTSRHLTYFDELAEREGYAGAIETPLGQMASSHQVKRLFCQMGQRHIEALCRFLRTLFRRRLKQHLKQHLKQQDAAESPEEGNLEEGNLEEGNLEEGGSEVIVLGLDSMVMDNDQAEKREGVKPTYQGTDGFHPLHLTWGRLIIDADFREGSAHCNRGDGAYEMIRRAVESIRAVSREVSSEGSSESSFEQVPILVRMDAGFYDTTLMDRLDALGVGYLIAGRREKEMDQLWDLIPETAWTRLHKDASHGASHGASRESSKKQWRIADIQVPRPRLSTSGAPAASFRRALYSRVEVTDEGQYLLPVGKKTESILYTNIEKTSSVGRQLLAAGREALLKPDALLQLYHGRGSDEQVHRRVKDFGFEALPFQNFRKNEAFYLLMLIAFFCQEVFKESVCEGLLPAHSYPTRLRRTLIDVAAKVVRSARTVRLKIPKGVFEALRFERLFQRADEPPLLVAG